MTTVTHAVYHTPNNTLIGTYTNEKDAQQAAAKLSQLDRKLFRKSFRKSFYEVRPIITTNG